MATRQRVLVLDDDPDILEICRELLQRLPSRPEVEVAGTGPMAISMLETAVFSLFVTDLSMPAMDGLQVLAQVRRRWPELLTVAISGVADEELRRRACGMGVEFYCAKPATVQEIKAFLSQLERLLRRSAEATGRPAAGRRLAEVVHLECLARNTSLIRCGHGGTTGSVWIERGEVIDATAGELIGAEALEAMLSWPGTKCDVLPGDPRHPRRILNAQQQFLLGDLGKWMEKPDRGPGGPSAQTAPPALPELEEMVAQPVSLLDELMELEGVESVLVVSKTDAEARVEARGLANSERWAGWLGAAWRDLSQLGQRLRVGEVVELEAATRSSRLVSARKGDRQVSVGFRRSLSLEKARETLREVWEKWES
jgi:CheY-like chemotaxis protein